MRKQGLSIRYKFLLLLTSIPLIVLTTYLVLALRIFENDKVAYVFDSSSNVSGTMAAQIKTQLNASLSAVRPLFQDYLLQGKFTAISDSIFANESNLEAVVALTPNASGSYIPVAQMEKQEKTVSDVFEQLGDKYKNYIYEVYNQNRIVKVPFKDDRILLFEKVADDQSKKITIFMVVLRLSEIAELFKSNSAQKMYLVSKNGNVLFGPDESLGKLINSFFDISFINNTNEKVSQGAETSKAIDGTDLLVSFSKAGFSDLYVVSATSKDKALGALQLLIHKSVIFFVILISLTAIIGLLASNNLTSALTDLFSATKKVSEGDFNFRVRVNSTDEIGTLADNFNIMAEEVSRLLAQTAEKARMESELQTAKTVQETLFPLTNATIGPLKISGHYEPASECGGDWWHYCFVGDKIFLWIGDVTGHGAPAALITSAARSASSIIEGLDVSPSKAMEFLNRAIYDVSKGKIMMTFFLASFDPKTNVLTYCNASHEAPFLMRAGTEPLKKKDLEPLNEVNNPRLGQARDSQYKEVTVDLASGDSLFFYTDGIPDIQNPKKEIWGEREFIKNLVSANKDRPDPSESVARFVSSFESYRSSTPLIDDVTFFIAKLT